MWFGNGGDHQKTNFPEPLMVEGVIDFKVIALIVLLSDKVITFTLPFSILWNRVGGGVSYGTSEERSRNLQNKTVFVCECVLKLVSKFKKLRKKHKGPPPPSFIEIKFTYHTIYLFKV